MTTITTLPDWTGSDSNSLFSATDPLSNDPFILGGEGTAFPPLDSPSVLVQSASGPSVLGQFFSGLAGDASSILSGLTNRVTTQQAIQTNNAIRQNGYTVPLFAPGLGGAMPTSTLLFLGLILIVFLMVK